MIGRAFVGPEISARSSIHRTSVRFFSICSNFNTKAIKEAPKGTEEEQGEGGSIGGAEIMAHYPENGNRAYGYNEAAPRGFSFQVEDSLFSSFVSLLTI